MGFTERPIKGERVVITGATDGIGKELARALARRGAALTLIARNEAKAAATASEFAAEPGAEGTPDVVIADLSDFASVRRAADELHDRYDRIDVLINNAGMSSFRQPTTHDGYEMMMAANHLGPFLLTNLTLDLVTKAAPSRIVFTASEAHRQAGRPDVDGLANTTGTGPLAAGRAYARSKLMNILVTQELAERLDGTGVTVNCFCPGAVATGLNRESRIVMGGAALLSRTPLLRVPEQGAALGVRLVLDPALAETSGQFFTSTPGLRFLPATSARKDRDYRRRVWDKSAELVGLVEA
jgi:retinol dehydrogenase-12